MGIRTLKLKEIQLMSKSSMKVKQPSFSFTLHKPLLSRDITAPEVTYPMDGVSWWSDRKEQSLQFNGCGNNTVTSVMPTTVGFISVSEL